LRLYCFTPTYLFEVSGLHATVEIGLALHLEEQVHRPALQIAPASVRRDHEMALAIDI